MDRVNAKCAALIAAVGLCACAPPTPPYPELPRLGVSAQIGSKNMCGLGMSPAIAISDVPGGTTQYALQITNIDVLYQQPWRATVLAVPTGIAEGAATNYDGPCLGDRQTYRYRIDVMAQDGSGRPLAYGQEVVQLYPIDRTVKSERDRKRQRPGTPTLDTVDPIEAPDVLTTNPGTNPVANPVLNPALNPNYRGF